MNLHCRKLLSPQSVKISKKQVTVKRCFYIKAKEKDEYENYQVFQHKHALYNDNIHIEEVDEHLDAVQKLEKEDKDDYFMSYGLDYDRCYEYINVIKYLNRCLTTASKSEERDNNKKEKFRFPGWSIIGFLAFMYYFVKDDI
jgi:hypothetical protein